MISRHSINLLARKLEVRISEEAVDYLKEVLEELADFIAAEAVELSQYAGRRTVMEKDVEFVVRKLFRDLI